MRKIYLAVAAVFVLSILLFVSSLVYLDKEKHKLYNFIVNVDGHDVEAIKIDKFVTEDRLIYKSSSDLPFDPILDGSKERLTLDKSYGLISYSEEEAGNGVSRETYIEQADNKLSFVATLNSEFAFMTDIPVKKGTFVFREDSPLTYLPILENYDFRTGRSQAFNIITNTHPLLPPMKQLLTLTSIRDEYIKIGSRKLKVECLVIKRKNSPQGMLWVTKSGRSLVEIEFPEKKLKLYRTFLPKKIGAKPLTLVNDAYREEEIRFNSKKTVLAGTLTTPLKNNLHPAVLLIGGPQATDRQNNGLFTYIADMLGRAGYVVLRFDRRGIGLSSGDSKSTTDRDTFDDASAALDYILSRTNIDPQRIAITGHDKGAFFAAKLASERKNVRALVLMAPLVTTGSDTDLNFDSLNEMSTKLKWDDQYLKLAIKSRMETIEKAKKTKNDWASLLRTRCFLKKLREDLEEKPMDIIRGVGAPVLILHGKEDEFIPAKSSATLDNALEESGNKNHKLIYYGYLGHFFGKKVNNGVNKEYYETDKGVLETIGQWLENNLLKIDLTLPESYDILPVNKPKEGGE